MPLVYIHGVNTRSPAQGVALGDAFQRWLGPKLGDDLPYFPVYWGDIVADQYRWGMTSRPRTAIRYAGGGDWAAQVAGARDAASSLLSMPAPAAEADSSVIGRAGAVIDRGRLTKVKVEDRGDVAADLFLLSRAADGMGENEPPAGLVLAAGKVADQWDDIVKAQRGDATNATAIVQAVGQRLEADSGLLAAGGWDLGARAKEALSRLVTLPGDALSVFAAEARPAANEFAANFLGDVLTYLHARGTADAPGRIPQRVLEGLRAANAAKRATGRPLVVVTHSMGGQLMLDAVSYYANVDEELADLKVDHWFTCGSQCSFFAELGLFQDQPDTHAPDKLKMPDRVAKWTNFHDMNDFVSFIMSPVFADVVDIEYNTGCGIIGAHTAYLTRPSFFRLLADHL